MERAYPAPSGDTDADPCRAHGSELSVLLERMSEILLELAEETSEIQWHVAPLINNAGHLEPAALGDLQRLDRHAQYLVELGRMTGGLSTITAARSISVPALCRLVRLPSLRNRFLCERDTSEAEQEAGSVSLF